MIFLNYKALMRKTRVRKVRKHGYLTFFRKVLFEECLSRQGFGMQPQTLAKKGSVLYNMLIKEGEVLYEKD